MSFRRQQWGVSRTGTMRRRDVTKFLLLVFFCLWALSTFLLAFTLFVRQQQQHDDCILTPTGSLKMPLNSEVEASVELSQKPHLCLLVPFRDRFDELLEFAPHMKKFLKEQGIPNTIFIINQVDLLRFNRASLLNVGFRYATEDKTDGPVCSYIALHDVDLLPINPILDYGAPPTRDRTFPKGRARHLAPAGMHPKYDYPSFLGGAMLMWPHDFRRVDGMSNNYWGWGLEDDEFGARMREAGIEVTRQAGLNTGMSDTFRHLHVPRKRSRDYRKCYDQRDVTRRRDRYTGLSTLKFKVVSASSVVVNDAEVTVVSVELECDKTKTPYCDCQGAPATEAPLKPIKKNENIMPYLPKKQKNTANKRRKKK